MATRVDCELGDYEGNWWWRLNVYEPYCRISGDKMNYKSRGASRRAALAVAKRFGLTVQAVYEEENQIE